MPTARTLSLNKKYYVAGVISDGVVAAISVLGAVQIRFGYLPDLPLVQYMSTVGFFFLGYLITSVIENLYSVRTTLNHPMLLYRTMRMVFIVTGTFMLLIFLFKGGGGVFIDSRFVIVLNMFGFLILTLLSKLFLLPNLFKTIYGGKRSTRSNLLIEGNPEKNKRVAQLLKKSKIYATGERIVQSMVELPETPEEIAQRVADCTQERNCSGAVVLFDERHSMNCIAETCVLLYDSGIPFVIYGPHIFDLGYFDPWFSLDDYGAITFIKKGKKDLTPAIGRMVDIVLAMVFLLIVSPIMLVTAVLVKTTSKGPVLFRQERVGKGLSIFPFLKFRSMKVGSKNKEAHREYFKNYAKGKSAEGDGETYKLDQSSRVTTIGRVIRKTSIDELPQLINVLRGEMAIVGPRPCIQYELEHYLGWQRRRFMIKPGLTGIWQVYGRSRLPFDKAQFLDFLYTIDASHSLDFRLLMKTIPVVLFGKGGL